MSFFFDPDGNSLMLHHRYAPRATKGLTDRYGGYRPS
jgi:hypothetical protein